MQDFSQIRRLSKVSPRKTLKYSCSLSSFSSLDHFETSTSPTTVDEDLVTSGVPSTTDFLRGKQEEDVVESCDGCDDLEDSPCQVTISEAAETLEAVLLFMEQNATDDIVCKVDSVIDAFKAIRLKRSRQSEIVDFFHVC